MLLAMKLLDTQNLSLDLIDLVPCLRISFENLLLARTFFTEKLSIFLPESYRSKKISDVTDFD